MQQTMADETITLSQAETQKITTDVFSADCGNYSARLVVTDPNETSAEKMFIIAAP
jgi:hypothetical protein